MCVLQMHIYRRIDWHNPRVVQFFSSAALLLWTYLWGRGEGLVWQCVCASFKCTVDCTVYKRHEEQVWHIIECSQMFLYSLPLLHVKLAVLRLLWGSVSK